MSAPQGQDATTSERRGSAKSTWWPRVKRLAFWVFFAVVAGLIVKQARTIDWSDVLDSMLQIRPSALFAALALAAGSHLLYSTYDLLGRHITGHPLKARTVMGITFISYAFNLNLGSLVGGVAFRYRLYSRHRLGNSTITRVLGFSMLTNWFGYLVVAGIAFAGWPMDLPPNWKIGNEGLRLLGFSLLALAVAYLALCGFSTKRSLHLRGHELQIPSLRLALLQMVMSCANWALIGGVIWLLLQREIAYPQVLAVLLVAAVAGVVTHVPAGLGVLEAVFVALLAHQMAEGRLIASLLAYRAIYYLLPLVIATVGYLWSEWHAKRRGAAPSHPAGRLPVADPSRVGD